MAGVGAITPEELASKTGIDARYACEWLSLRPLGGSVTYDTVTKSFTLPDEQAFPSAVPDSPAYLPGAFHIISLVIKDEAAQELFGNARACARRRRFEGSKKSALTGQGWGRVVAPTLPASIAT